MTIARNIEAALQRYLSNESDSTVGGIYFLKTQSGAGTQLSIRTGHDDAGVLPDAGFILCLCNEAEIEQPVMFANLFNAPAVVQLVYPAENYSSDTATLTSFEALQYELERLLVCDDIADKLTDQGEGCDFRGQTSGIRFETSIEGHRRVAEWRFSFAVSGYAKQA